jgi:arsenate reductase-like glutaredoxin family protein
MKKAFAWLDQHGVAYDFHDYKRVGVTQARLAHWCRAFGWETVLNRGGNAGRSVSEVRGIDRITLAEAGVHDITYCRLYRPRRCLS